MRHTTWVVLIILVLAGWALLGSAHDACAEAEGEHDGLMCGVLTAPETVETPGDVPFESPALAELPASLLRPLDHPPRPTPLSMFPRGLDDDLEVARLYGARGTPDGGAMRGEPGTRPRVPGDFPSVPCRGIVHRRTTILGRWRMPLALPRRLRRSSPARRETDLTRDLAGLARALGHPARIRIVQTLIDKQACIGCDLVDETGLAQSTVSEHLRILRAAGIITGEIERPRVCYSLNPTALEPLRAFLTTAVSPGRSRSSRRA